MPFNFTAPEIKRLVSKRDLGGLTTAIGSEDKDTRWMAAGGLGELCDPRAIEPLIRALADVDPDVRWKAAEALGSIGDTRATEVLIPLLRDPDGIMRLQEVWALGKIRDQSATAHIIPFLTDPDYDVRIAAVWALGAIGGGRAVAALREMLLDRHPGIRSKAAESLEKCGWKPVDDRERGAFAFARRDWEEVSHYGRRLEDILIWALDDRYFDVRMHAARILGTTRSRSAIPHLHKALDDPEECVTYEAAAALAEIGNAESKKALVHGLESPHLSTRKVAAGALDRLAWQPRSIYHESLFLSAKDDWIGLVRLKKHGVDPLARELQERCGVERASIAKALGAIGSPAIDAMIGLLGSPNPDIRWRAASILGDSRDRRAVEPLIAALADPDEHVSSSAAVALGEIRDEGAVDPLIRAYATGGPGLRRDIVAALGRTRSERAVAAIIAASGDENPVVRSSAVKAMGRIRDVRVLPALIPFFQDPDPAIRFEAVVAIRPYSGREIDLLLTRALEDPDAGVRREAARQAGSRGVTTAVQPLVGLFGDPDTAVRKAAARALERIGWEPSDSREQLAFLIAKEDWEEIQRQGLLYSPAGDPKSGGAGLLPGGLQGREGVVSPGPADQEKQIPQEEREVSPRRGVNVATHEAVPDLQYFIDILNDPRVDLPARLKAVEALGNLGDLRGVRPLMQALRDPESEIRGNAALSLGMLGDHKAFGSLVVALEDPVFEVKRRVAEALSVLKPGGAVLPLAELARSPNPGSRMLAVTVLGDFEEDDGVRALLGALNDEYSGVKSAALSSLLKLVDYWGSRIPVFLKDGDPAIRKNVLTALNTIIGEDKAISLLIPLLHAGNFSVRREAVLALEGMGWRPGLPEEHAMVLIAGREWDEVVILGKQAESALIGALFDTDREIRDGAVASLGMIGDDETVRSIRAAMRGGVDLQARGIHAAMKAASLIEEKEARRGGEGLIPSSPGVR